MPVRFFYASAGGFGRQWGGDRFALEGGKVGKMEEVGPDPAADSGSGANSPLPIAK